MSLSFTAGQKYLKLTTLARSLTSSSQTTVALWTYITGSSYQRICEYGDAGTGAQNGFRTYLGTGSDGTMRLTNQATQSLLSTVGGYVSSSWKLIVMRHNGAATTMTVDYNGTKYNKTDAIAFSSATLNDFSLGDFGTSDPGAFQLTGKLAHIAIWNTYLSDGDVSSLAGGSNPQAVGSGLIHYWPARDSGDGLTDLVGGKTLVQTGTGTDVAWDGAANPTVNPPSGGGSITLSMIERGRGVLRGLGRGL